MYCRDFLNLATYFSHYTGPSVDFGSASPIKGQRVGLHISLSVVHLLGARHPEGLGQKLALDNTTSVLRLVLPETRQRVLELGFACLDGRIVLLLVLLPDSVPMVGVLRLIRIVLVLQGEIFLDELEP